MSNKNFRRSAAALTHPGAPLIVAGLAALILVAAIPAVPAVTAMSILTLGATNAILDRVRNSPVRAAALLLHAATYASLYLLFVGTTLHAADTISSGVVGTLPALDLAASVLPMAMSLQRVVVALLQRSEPQR